METDLKVPCAFCPTCVELGPVIVEEINPGDWMGSDQLYVGDKIIVVYCPNCQNILNLDGGDVEVQWYTLEDLPKATGWRANG